MQKVLLAISLVFIGVNSYAAELNIFCDQKQGLNITMQADYTRLTGALIS